VTDDRHRVEEAAADEAAASSTGGRDPSERTTGEIAEAFDSRPAGDGETSPATGPPTPKEEDPLEAARGETALYREHLQRLQAEFENYRKRVLKEQSQAVELAAKPVFQRLLEVLDDFGLALLHAQDRPDYDRFLHGVELVYAKLVDTLRAEGLERIEAQGEPFDPELHEALMQTGSGEGDLVVADVLRPGYTLKGRVLRPAGVRVERT
jgi:molecular chaperone GrpE